MDALSLKSKLFYFNYGITQPFNFLSVYGVWLFIRQFVSRLSNRVLRVISPFGDLGFRSSALKRLPQSSTLNSKQTLQLSANC